MTPGERSRTRPAPSAHCRLCSATASIDAPSTDQLRISLRQFMADHRHDGLADIVIDISDDTAESNDAEDNGDMAEERASVSQL